MDRQRRNVITWVFVLVTALAVGLMLFSNLRRTSYITLPSSGVSDSSLSGDETSKSEVLTVAEIQPDTVQAAVETLVRPENYRRSVTVEQIWSGGRSTTDTIVTVAGKWTRLDWTLLDGQVRHTITDGETTYVWYNDESEVFSGVAGNITADQEQRIPTYEDILSLPVNRIKVADYRTASEIDCIFVETETDEYGYSLRYWVSVETGLLVMSEKLLNEEPVYRMASLSAELTGPLAESFVLPDGTVLYNLES